ncbi:unnamed protein product [Adineta ricciae]|uniref:Uncharacterized protein n=1 Tax=Adineta ricciae TaxID=249248 RepID=A0A814ZHI1_ADIRI|nr:unnamed protein product [Adineta ricciae]CAF1243327.1 unnamed protein product [Adineta ricciae]
MYRYKRHPLLSYLPRMDFFRVLRICCLFACVLCLILQYVIVKLFYSDEEFVVESTQLDPNIPLTINLTSFAVCHSQDLYLDNLNIQYHGRYPDKNKQVCFLVEHLDGGPWWSYVTHEFAEILTSLKEFGRSSNITYRSFSDQRKITHKTNLTKYFLDACGIDENIASDRERPVIILLWDVNQLFWYRMRREWELFFNSVRARVVVFIDDLHFTSSNTLASRQYLFESVASEILSTYAYLFHNYYRKIPSEKITWIPHAASSLTNRTINQTALNTLFVSGANIPEWYPCRAHAFALCHQRKDLASCLKHPGYGPTMRNSKAYYYGGERYFSYMRQFRFGLGTCQSVHYAVAKLFEIPANGLVLVTTHDLIPVLEKLHLKQNTHFLTVNCSSTNSLKNEVMHLQSLPKKAMYDIRKRSQDIVYDRHLTRHRAELIHVRLLAQSLLVSSVSLEGNIQWEGWGRNC